MTVDYLLVGSAGSHWQLFSFVVGGCLVFVAGLAGCVYLRGELNHLRAQMSVTRKSGSSLAAELEAQALLVRQMSIDLEELRKRVGNQQESQPPISSSWGTPELPVNLNRRGQIIRLSRKGKSVAEIASDLRVGQGEVELLLKVHDLSQGTPEAEKS